MTTPIPQPPGIPLLGNIFDVNPSNSWASFKTLAEKYGEIFQITILGKTLVFVAGAALAEELCDERRFRKFVGGPIVEIRYAVHDSLFTAFDHEANWGVAHRIIAPHLSPDSVSAMFDAMRDATAELVEGWRGLVFLTSTVKKGNTVSPIAELNRLNLEVTTRTLYGKSLGGPDHPMIQAMEDATSEAMKRPTRPGFLNWLVYGGKFKRATDAMRTYAADMVKHRRDNPSTDRGDLLHALLNAKDPETGKALTDSQVIDEIVTMPIGSSTAPGLLSSALYYLASNPQVVSKARRELDAVVGRGKPLMREHLSQLKYVEGVLRESLRLSFAAPGFNIEPIPREGGGEGGGEGEADNKSPVLLAGGKYAVAHDQAMIVVLAGVNRDPTVFEEPLVFDPDRMVGEAFERLPLGVKRWFGNGKRECVGKHWAWQFSFVVLAALMREVDIEKADPGYELKQDGWFNLRPVDFYVKVKPRVD